MFHVRLAIEMLLPEPVQGAVAVVRWKNGGGPAVAHVTMHTPVRVVILLPWSPPSLLLFIFIPALSDMESVDDEPRPILHSLVDPPAQFLGCIEHSGGSILVVAGVEFVVD